MKKKYNLLLAILFLSVLATPCLASYKSVLKKWTRNDTIYVWDNLEARMNWHVTYLSDDFRHERLEKLSQLYEWNDAELLFKQSADQKEAERFDTFFMSIYAGSSQWAEIGKDNGKWRIFLEADGEKPIESVSFERLKVTQEERALYPYIDKWSNAYIVKFPKTIRSQKSFKLRMTGIPARSELIWK